MDSSAFYRSCERALDPSLVGVPIAVLSTDAWSRGATRSEDTGVPTGAPRSRRRAALAAAGVWVFNSTYTLYGDMSKRVADTVITVSPDVVPYSVGEASVWVSSANRTGDDLQRRMGPRPATSGGGSCSGRAPPYASRSRPIFGSYARGKQMETSVLDLLVSTRSQGSSCSSGYPALRGPG